MTVVAVGGADGEKRPRAWRRLVDSSLAADWEQARTEWEFTGRVVGEGEADFLDVCELCHQPNLRANYEIRNPHTDAAFLVGRECIRHYLILAGAETIEDSQRLFNQQERQARLLKAVLRPAAAAVLAGEPTWDQVYRLHTGAQTYLGCRSRAAFMDLDAATWLAFLAEIAGVAPNVLGHEDACRLRDAILDPSRVAKAPRNRTRNPSAAELAGRRGRSARTTLSAGQHVLDPATVTEIDPDCRNDSR